MRTFQLTLGLAVVLVGLLSLLAVNGAISFGGLDIAAVALIVSGLLFVVPALVWRGEIPWLTALFIPGALAFAAGAFLLYTGRAGLEQGWYAFALFIVAPGLAFLAMYYLGPHARWLWITGILIGGSGLFLLAVLMTIFGAAAAVRIVGSVVLIGLGLAFAFAPLMRRRVRRV